MQEGNVLEHYNRVIEGLDALLAEHGYVRDGEIYRAEKSNCDTIVFFCHFGVEAVILSHLMNVSPMPLWHHMVALPSSVTTLTTEERREGKATFRMSSFGDLSHLYAGDEEPSFAARFCEVFDSEDRH
jgi:probable phosphoglycerate mutase